jgi:hypothetical protein
LDLHHELKTLGLVSRLELVQWDEICFFELSGMIEAGQTNSFCESTITAHFDDFNTDKHFAPNEFVACNQY